MSEGGRKPRDGPVVPWSAKYLTGMYLEGQATPASPAVPSGGMPSETRRGRAEEGFALAALLVAVGILSIMLLVALPAWRHQAQREKEAELIFRGQQYARAIGLYQRKLAGSFPPNIDVLVEQKFLRKKYKDPITGEEFVPIYANTQVGMDAMRQGQQQQQPGAAPGAAPPGTSPSGAGPTTFQSPMGPQGRGAAQPGTRLGGAAGGIVGVMSKSTAESIRLYNGRSRYNQWIFTYMAAAQPGEQQIGPGQLAPGQLAPGQAAPGSPLRGTGPGMPRPDQRGSGRQSGFGQTGRGRGGQ